MRSTLRRFLLLLGLASFFFLQSGCETTEGSSATSSHPHTLAGNPKIKTDILREFYRESHWRRLKDRPYRSFVHWRATIKNDHTVVLRKPMRFYPDASVVEPSRSYAEMARVSPITVGTNIRSSADIYVVVYDSNVHVVAGDTIQPRTDVLIFGRRSGTAAPTGSVGGSYYLNIVYDDIGPSPTGEWNRRVDIIEDGPVDLPAAD